MGTLSQWSGAGRESFPPLVGWRNARTLAASTAESVTVPTGAKRVIFRSTGTFYARGDGTAAIPTDVTDGSASAVNPGSVTLNGVTTISLISPDAVTITLDFFK